MDYNDFLKGLAQPRRSYHFSQRKPANDIFFMISGKTNNLMLTAVDKKLRPIDIDPCTLSGESAVLLRSMERICERGAQSVEWDEEPTEGICVKISDNPQLVFQIIRSDKLIDADGHPIGVSNETKQVVLNLKAKDEENEKVIKPSLTLANTEEDGGEIDFLSDSFVLCGNTIYPINDIGDNYNKMPFFLGEFRVNMLAEYLSVLYSYIENIEVDYGNYVIEHQTREIVPRPTLVFEKVNEDHTLFMRLAQQVKGLSVDFVLQFGVSVVASIIDNTHITVRPISSIDIGGVAESLYKMILKYAPTREDARQVYCDDDLLFIIPESVAGPFLLSALPQLLNEYQLVGAEKLENYKVRPLKPKLKMRLSSGIDFLEGDASMEIGGEQFSIQQVLAQYGKKRYVELSDGNRAIIDDAYMRKLERIFSRKGGKGGKIKISFFDFPEVEDLLNETLDGPAFTHHRKVYEGFNKLAKKTLRTPNLNATLRPYQKEGIKWMKYLYDNNLGGCLADDMGLGKTVQTIGLLTLAYPQATEPTLIVMPRSLLFNWQNEIKRFAPQLSVYTYYAGNRDLAEALKHQVILTTYALVRNDIETLHEHHFHMVILDESQNIKNIAAQTTQATHLLKTDHKLALSGTPIENNLTELYSLFRFLNPTMFGSADEFNARYTNPIQHDDDKDAMLSLRRKIFPFMLRRLKKDVLKDLPDRIEQTLYVEMTPEQHDFYEQRRKYYLEQVNEAIATQGIQKSQFVMLQALSELRRIASVPESLSDGAIESPKLSQLLDAVIEAVENGHKVVVFFNFIAGLELAGERLEEAGIEFCSMTGATHDRRTIVERFQNSPRCAVMLMTLKTGGVGLNLTAADTVFIFEPWWNKAAEEQAINRLHRIGQKNKVLSYSLITSSTIEEKIQLLQQQKADLFEGLISADSSSAKHLSEEDIRFILG